MSSRDIIFIDINTIWHRRLAEALAEQTRVIAVAPSIRRSGMETSDPSEAGKLRVIEAILPPGWASRTAFIGQRMLARLVKKIANGLDDPVIVLTSPAYEALSRYLGDRYPLVTYTADDYAGYANWQDARPREARMQSRACLAVFVSQALRDRAISDDGIAPERTLVSPNATERRFAGPARALPAPLQSLKKPVLGVLGGLSPRLDMQFIEQVIGLPEVGTFLVAGPVDADLIKRFPLLGSPKVVITGALPHDEMHHYALAMDAALIPYGSTALNHFCSPMLLYDHLATGVPIFSLATCDQIAKCEAPGLTVSAPEELLACISREISDAKVSQCDMAIYWSDRSNQLLNAIDDHCPRIAKGPRA